MAVAWAKFAKESDVITKAFMAAKGDILYASAGGVPAVLAIGGDNEVLRVSTDIPAWEAEGAPAAHALDSHTVPAGAVDFDLKEATDLVVFTVADETARDALAAAATAVGQLVFATTELSLSICVESS